MRKTERLHAIARQLAIRKNCYSINHHSLFKVRNAECLNHRLWLIVTAGLVRQLFWDTQQTFVCCWCYYITYVCMCQHLFLNFLKLFSGRFYPDTYACTSTIEKSLLLYLNCLTQVYHCLTQDASLNIAQSYTRLFIYLAQVAQFHTFLFRHLLEGIFQKYRSRNSGKY